MISELTFSTASYVIVGVILGLAALAGLAAARSSTVRLWLHERAGAAVVADPDRLIHSPLSRDGTAAGLNLTGNPVAESALVDASDEEATSSPPKLSIEIVFDIAAIVALGLLLSLFIATRSFPTAHAPWVGLVLFVGLVVLAHRFAADVDGRATTSVAVVPMIATALLFNAVGTIAAAFAFALVAKLKAHSPLHRMLFNVGCMLLSIGSAELTFRLFIHGSLGQTRYEWTILPGMLAGLVFYLVNHLLVCLIRSRSEHRRLLEIWRDDYRWLWPHYVAAGLLGVTLSVTYEVMGWLVTLVMASPVALMHLTITQFISRTTGYVNELRRLNRQLGDSYESTLQALSRALDTRDAETEEHSQRVSRYTELIGGRFGLSDEEIAHLRRGAILHDIGKIGVPDAILLKPAGLTSREVEAMRQHPKIGHTMIAHIPFLEQAAEIVLHHHESYDGSGYPSGLAGTDIPLGARIFAVVDTLDAMTSDRPYRKALTFEEALTEIEQQRGHQFDPAIVDTLLSVPIADLVQCRNGAAPETIHEPERQPAPTLSTAPA